MSSDFEIKGADQVLRLSKALKAAGLKDLRKALHKGLREAAKPLIPKTRAAARAQLPQRGGLAALVAKQPQRVAVKTGADPGISLIVSPRRGSGARLLDEQGAVRHPVFGNRQAWVRQEAPSARGWFSDTAQEEAPAIRGDLERALQEMAQRIVREVG